MVQISLLRAWSDKFKFIYPSNNFLKQNSNFARIIYLFFRSTEVLQLIVIIRESCNADETRQYLWHLPQGRNSHLEVSIRKILCTSYERERERKRVS